jgi:transcriptional regulator GlxA family with amidase domain
MAAGVRNVPENLMVEEIARYAGFSARQLQR